MSDQSYNEMVAEAKRLGINSYGLKKPELAAAIAAHSDTGTRAIKHTNALGHWWCPYCDHSHTGLINDCRGCGATRDGDKVVKA